MDETRKRVLTALLQQAVKGVQIHNSPSATRPKRIMSPSSYRALYLSDKYDPNIMFARILYAPYVQDQTVESHLLDTLRDEFGQFVLEDRVRCATPRIFGGMNSYPLDRFLQELLKIAVVYSVESTVSFLEKCFSQNYIDFQEMTLLDGIQIDRELQISSGVRLILLSHSSDELPDILPFIPPNMQNIDFPGKTVAVMDFSISPRFQKPQDSRDDFQIKLKDTEFFKFDLDKFLHHLSLACHNPIVPVMRWCHTNKMEPFVIPSGFTSWTEAKFPRPPVTVSESDILVAKDLYRKFDELNSDVQEKLSIAVSRWVKSKNEPYVDRIIDLGIAFEVLYLGGSLEQLSFTFRLRASWHLGNSPSERQELMRVFKKVYNFRSKAVHTGQLPDDKETGEMLDKADELCARAIMKFINDGGFPDWVSLVTGES